MRGRLKTNQDRRELAKFSDFLRRVFTGKSQQQAYAETYGKTIFEAAPASATAEPAGGCEK